MPAPRRPADLSRLARALGREVRSHLDTSAGYPTHHRATAAALRRLRRALKSPDAAVRAAAIARLRRSILGEAPSPAPRTR